MVGTTATIVNGRRLQLVGLVKVLAIVSVVMMVLLALVADTAFELTLGGVHTVTHLCNGLN
jgi:hypothetical protein